MILGVNGVGVARYGLILWENDATGSRKVSRYLWGLRGAVSNSKMTNNIKKKRVFLFQLLYCFYLCFLYIHNSRSTAHGGCYVIEHAEREAPLHHGFLHWGLHYLAELVFIFMQKCSF